MRLLLALLLLIVPATGHARTGNDAKPALWKLSDADTTIWLFGSVHVLNSGIRWFDGPVAKAFTRSDELVVETELTADAASSRMMMERAFDRNGKPLRSELTPQQRVAYDKLLVAYGLNPATFDQFKPWFAATSLTSIAYRKLGYASEHGVEMVLFREAKKTAKPIISLESLEEQVALLDSFARPVQLRMLAMTLDELNDGAERATTLIDAWRAGDAAALAREMNDGVDELPELRAVLLDRRNERFARWIAGRLAKPGTVFVAVGAGHFGGKHNVRELLEAKGFRIRRVQ
ncbi:MAG: TraB/GumN family protein [Sphingomonadaceae bacterium]